VHSDVIHSRKANIVVNNLRRNWFTTA